jgi:hypothetical protein
MGWLWASTAAQRTRWQPASVKSINEARQLVVATTGGRGAARRHPAASTSGVVYALPKSGTEMEPSAASGNPGLWAISQIWPSGSAKQPA